MVEAIQSQDEENHLETYVEQALKDWPRVANISKDRVKMIILTSGK